MIFFFFSWQFINRQFIPDGTYSSSEKEQGDEWSTETEVCCEDDVFLGLKFAFDPFCFGDYLPSLFIYLFSSFITSSKQSGSKRKVFHFHESVFNCWDINQYYCFKYFSGSIF